MKNSKKSTFLKTVRNLTRKAKNIIFLKTVANPTRKAKNMTFWMPINLDELLFVFVVKVFKKIL